LASFVCRNLGKIDTKLAKGITVGLIPQPLTVKRTEAKAKSKTNNQFFCCIAKVEKN
jgi:hypothetical protein